MKIAFLCSSLEPGRDGVGDYTRRLSGEMIRQGHPATAVALNDPYVVKTASNSQEIEDTAVSVLRLPGALSWKERMTGLRHWLDALDPDWISLQFVPFGFHPKGLCSGLGKNLEGANRKAPWHVMFHELWLGLGENSPFKHRVLGGVQRLMIMDLMRRLQPRLVTTQAESYRIVLNREKIKAPILPLFSNIPRIPGDGWRGILEPLVAQAAGRQTERAEVYLAGVLGMVAPEWQAGVAVNTLLPLAHRFHKRLILVFHGKNDLGPAMIDKLRITLRGRADVVFAGERSSGEISKILQTLDIGIATTPRQIIQKSGSVAAMLEHGLPILVTRNDWRLRGPDAPVAEESPRLLSPEQLLRLETLPARQGEPPEESGVKRVASQMLAAMNPAADRSGNLMAVSGVLHS